MFNKLLSNLPFNPSLIGQVSFYHKRLREEQSLRRFGLLFVGLALFIQIFAVMVPPQQSLAASDSNIMVGGGSTTKEGILMKYDSDAWVRYVYEQFYHITRDDIVKMQVVHIHLSSSTNYGTTTLDNKQTFSVNSSLYTAGRRPNGSAGEQQFDAAGAPIYQHTLKSAFRSSPITALYCGAETCGRYKAIAMDCGNPITDTSETTPVPPAPVPAPAPAPPPPAPAPSPVPYAECTSLTLVSSSVQVKKLLSVKVAAGAGNGGKIYHFMINYGDGTAPVSVNANPAGEGSSTHVYSQAGSYTITATAKTSLGDKTSAGCTAAVSVTKIPTPCPYDNSLTTDDSSCKPCAEDSKLPASDAKCAAVIIKAKAVSNTTQKLKDANGTTAKSNDELVYTLTTTNNSKVLTEKGYVVTESIADILDYADVVSLDGGTLDDGKVLKWAATDIPAGGKEVKTLTFKVKDPIPSTNVASSDAGTYDLKMVNVYGDTVVVNVTPPVSKIIETTTAELPNTGPGTSLAIGFVATTIFAYFFARSRLMARELELVRIEYTSGGGF